mmetsp:Transcript_48528/g.41046  ORF Transcript_48528/g.41046 Transcript_48528/m.41046 type:complete len:158 (+) Transcript_48528:445-918(+)
MDQTAKTAKELVEEVKKLTPIVTEQKAEAEKQSLIADAAEKKANIVLETQKDEKAKVEKMVDDATAIENNVKTELAKASEVRKKAEKSVANLKDADVTEVKGFNVKKLAEKPGIEDVLKAIMLLLTGKPDYSVWNKTINVKNLRDFNLDDIENNFEY